MSTRPAAPPSPQQGSTPAPPPRQSRWEAWLWTGPLGHLLGGSMDFLQANARYALARLQGRTLR